MEIKRGTSAENPFPGLRPFRDEEGYLFFGRESQVDLMVDKLAKRHFLAVVGTSGSGKSSLVNCGLRPALQGGLMAAAGIRWRMVQFRPGNNALRAMARALAEDDAIRSKFDFDQESLQGLVEASLRMSKRGLSEVYKRAQFAQGTNLLIVVDQFEELFRFRDVDSAAMGNGNRRSQEATAFVNLLLDAKTQSMFPIYSVLTMRSDFLGECAEFPGLPEAINDGQYLVPRLTRDERRVAISGPVGVGGARISPLLLTRLVNDVGDNPDQLSILQHAMNRTWARWKHEEGGEGELDLSDYETIGTMSHALDLHAEKAYGELRGPRQQKICEKIFKALTDKRTDPGIRRPTKFATLCDLAEASAGEVTAVINIFRKPSRSFLMPPLPEVLEADTVVDISHESLMRLWERLKRWTDEEVQSAQLYRRLSETAAWHAAGKAALWDDPDLQLALDWKNKELPTARWAALYGGGFEQGMSFLTESEKQRDWELQEKEELRRRELRQVQALAEERQQRLEQQAQATRRLRGWLGALAGVAVLLLLVVAYAEQKRIAAKQQEKIAGGAKQEALLRASDAEKARQEAVDQASVANEERRKAEKAKQETASALHQAKEALTEMHRQALRTRDVNLEFMSDYADLADALIQNSSPEQAAMWRGEKGLALVALGNYEDAEPVLRQALKVVPDDVSARTTRGYMFLLRKQPGDAMKDFTYIRDHIDPGSALNYLNLTIAQAELGDFAGARISLNRAIEFTQSRKFDGGAEAAVPPDITQATGRTTLKADRATFLAALYYMRANLEAYEGKRNAFEDALSSADKEARPLPSTKRNDAYFIAMTWAWLHLDARCPESASQCRDYGALVSEAALWERVGKMYQPWAACDYERFWRKYSSLRDSWYVSLAGLVEEKKKTLGFGPAPYCFTKPKRDALTLETEAREDLARKKYQEANKLFSDAFDVAEEPDKMRLLLGKAYALYLTGRAAREKGQLEEAKAAFNQLQSHCNEILSKDPREGDAYYWRAIARDWLDASANREKILNDLQSALEINPADVNSLRLLDRLTPDRTPGDDVAYLKHFRPVLARYYKMSPYTSRAFLHQAKLARDDKRYDDAEKFINAAIAMEPEDYTLYDVRREIENSRGKEAPATIEQNYRRGLYQARFTLKRRDNPEDAQRLATIEQMINAERSQNSPGK